MCVCVRALALLISTGMMLEGVGRPELHTNTDETDYDDDAELRGATTDWINSFFSPVPTSHGGFTRSGSF